MTISNIEFEATDRVRRIREQIVSSKPKVCDERALLITESYKETTSDSIMLRRAHAYDKILRNISTPIYDDELIVGHLASERRSCPVYPEMDISWLEEEIDTLSTRKYDQFEIEDKVKNNLRKIFPYWKDRGILDKIFAAMPDETRKARLESNVFSVTAHEETGFGHVLINHKKILNEGLLSIIDKINAVRSSLNLAKSENIKKEKFYRAQIICLEATIAWAERYADKAREMAKKEMDSSRKAELLKIANVCSHVPKYPASNFHEALQAVWFIHLAIQLETDGVAITVGRLDQFAYPFLKKDLKNGGSKKDLQELLDCFWLKFAEMVKLYKFSSAMVTSGFPMGQNIIIGGTDEYGREAVNELSFMCLESHRHCRLYEPNFSVRINRNISEKFLLYVCENLRMGTGHPVIFNEDVAIQSLCSYGISLKEARNYAPIGCVENSVVEMWMRSNGGYFCLAKVLELAVHNGICQITGKRVGPSTGNLEDFTSFEDFFENGYKKQVAYFTKHLVIENNVIDMIHSELVPIPLVSSFFDSCIENGKCVTQGGAKYNFTCPGGVGAANTADGLAAIKYLIYDKKLYTALEIREALKNNFKSYAEIQNKMLKDSPQYGNDVPYVDILARKAVDIWLDELDKYTNYRGGRFVAGLTAITANISFGKNVAATPDGRNASQPLSEGIAPSPGRDKFGPTVAMRSVTNLDHVRIMKGIIYNQKFNPMIFEKKSDIKKFSKMLRAYCDLNGFQIQFNVIDKKTLIDAQKHPEKYRDLVVRVAGYSAYYTELSSEVQNQIIVRTEFTNT